MPYVRLSEKMLYLDSCCNSGEVVLFGAVPEGFSHVVLGRNTSTLITRGNCYPAFSEPEETELSKEQLASFPKNVSRAGAGNPDHLQTG